MKPTDTNDLFPETLLVSRQGDRIYTTSLKVAEYFHKRHDNVVRAIEDLPNLLKNEEIETADLEVIAVFWRRNFAVSSYQDSRGRTYVMYEMTEEGFGLLAMGFTGARAVLWKIKFLTAFAVQRAALIRMIRRFAHVTDVIRPSLRPTVEGTEAGLGRPAIAARLGKSPASVTYHRRQARRFGLL